MKRCFVSFLVLALAAPAARAHFIWIVPEPDGKTARVVFSDTLKPDDAELLDKISKSEKKFMGGVREIKDIGWTKDGDVYRLPSAKETPPRPQPLFGVVCTYGVVQRGKSDPFLLTYHAKAQIGAIGRGFAGVVDPCDRLALEIVPAGDVSKPGEFKLLWQGKPLGGAEIAVLAPGQEKAEEHKTDAAGRFSVGEIKGGAWYGLRARHVDAKEGEHEGKKYKESRHYATLVVRFEDAKPAGDAGKVVADPAATKLLAEARASRAVWKDFPGFTADVEVNFDGKTSKGKVTVSAGGKDVSIEGIDKPFEQWTRRQLESIVNHRLPGSGERETPCAFTDDVADHPLGREIRVLNDELHSSYRVRGKEIVVVNRAMKDRKFTITVLESMTNKEGKYLTTSYVIDYWNLKGGDLVRSEGTSQTWNRVGAFDLPGMTRVVTARGKSFDGEASEDAFSAKSLTLSNHKLLK